MISISLTHTVLLQIAALLPGNNLSFTDFSICGRNTKLDGPDHEFISAGTSDVEAGEFPWSTSIGQSDNYEWKVQSPALQDTYI